MSVPPPSNRFNVTNPMARPLPIAPSRVSNIIGSRNNTVAAAAAAEKAEDRAAVLAGYKFRQAKAEAEAKAEAKAALLASGKSFNPQNFIKRRLPPPQKPSGSKPTAPAAGGRRRTRHKQNRNRSRKHKKTHRKRHSK